MCINQFMNQYTSVQYTCTIVLIDFTLNTCPKFCVNILVTHCVIVIVFEINKWHYG